MAQLTECLHDLKTALQERRQFWGILNLHMWFNVSAEYGEIEHDLGNLVSSMYEEGHDEQSILDAQQAFITEWAETIRGRGVMIESIPSLIDREGRDNTAQTLARMLCESFIGPHATVKDPKDGILHLLHLSVRSQLCKSILVEFSGEAADYVLTLMTQRNTDGVFDEPLRSLWLEQRSTMLRLLLKLSKRSETIPGALFVTGITCAQKDNPIATGGNADIYLGDLSGSAVVLKRLRVFQGVREGRENIKEFCREALLWSQLSHPFVQDFIGVDKDTFQGHYCMVIPWMQHGSINKCREELETSGLPIPQNQWILELSMGVEYLHQEGVIHGDIRGNNILIDNNLHVRITDFGLAAYANSNTTSVGTIGGSTRWMAPELLSPDDSGLPTFESDVYAFGITCIEICTRKLPFPELNEHQVIQHVLKGGRPTCPGDDTASGRTMLYSLWVIFDSCWVSDPSERPPISNISVDVRSALRRQTVGAVDIPIELLDLENSQSTNTGRAFRSSIPSITIVSTNLVFFLYIVLSGNLVLGFPVILFSCTIYFVSAVCARPITSCIRSQTSWEVNERSFQGYCVFSMLIAFVLFPLLLVVLVVRRPTTPQRF